MDHRLVQSVGFWKLARGQYALLGELADLPRALLTAFFRDEEPDPKQKWKELLVPLEIASSRIILGFNVVCFPFVSQICEDLR